MLLLASIVATTALVPGLQSPHHTARLRSPLGRPAPRSPPLRALGPSFFDKLLYGERGKPSPPPPDELCAEDLCSVRDLRAVFAQWDTDGTGTLQLDELKRAFLAVGVEVDLEEAFATLDSDGDGLLTFEEFESGLPDAWREQIEARLNEDGVMTSLYVPPEKWDDTQTAKTIAWQRRVIFQAQRDGNRVRQNGILRDQLGGM